MKKVAFLLAIQVAFVVNVFSQSPQSFKYQAVARNSAGELISNQNISFQITILKDSINGIPVYTETHSVVSNQLGLVNLNIGEGNVVSGSFSDINWQDSQFYLKTEIDTAGGTSYQDMGTTQLLSVPYALNSSRSEGVTVVDSVSHLGDVKDIFVGRMVFVSESELLYVWRGDSWKIFGCFPMPTDAAAGDDTLIYGTLNNQFTFSLTGNVPEKGTGTWTLISGSNGVIADINDPASAFTGVIGSSYVLRWTIKTDCDSTYDDKNINSFGNCGLLTDSRDGKVYQTVKIDTMCWMAENLDYGTRIDGSTDQTDNSIAEKYCYNDDDANCDVYGGLYQWNEVMQYDTLLKAQGLCPDGWHIPSNIEWQELSNNLGGNPVSGGKLKESGYEHWSPPNTGAVNSYGFTAIPGGNRYYASGAFFSQGVSASFWTSSKASSTNAWRRSIVSENVALYQSSFSRNYGFSLRCLKN